MKIGDSVKIIDYNKCWYSYKPTVGCRGIIRGPRSSHGNYPVEVYGLFNEKSSRYGGCFWINEDYLILAKKESEKNNMSKLTGFEKVAVVDQGYKKCHFAIYNDAIECKTGDKIIVSGSTNVHIVSEVITIEEASKRFKGDITLEVIDIIDTSAYDDRVAKRKEASELKKLMDKTIKEMQEVDKYEMYAKQNPELKEMLDKFKELAG